MMKKNQLAYLIIIVCVVVLVIFLADDSIAQCSMCRKIATDGTNTGTVGKKLNAGILYLLAFPYVLVGFFFRKQIAGFFRAQIARFKK
jgi:membrane glycosyltransferase